jgi:DNA-binding MurR/RpiR family transcriptional regulator
VRFSQRLGYNGYPELLQDVREQVKSEIYAAYEPQILSPDDPAGAFRDRVNQEQQNLRQMLVHNPPEHVEAVSRLLSSAKRILLLGDGYAEAVAETVAQMFRHRGIDAEYLPNDAVKKASALMNVDGSVLVIGVSAADYGRDVARAMEFARTRGAHTLGVIGSMSSPANRMSELVIYAPTDVAGPLPSIVGLVTALTSLVLMAAKDSPATVERHLETFEKAYQFLTLEDAISAYETLRFPDET